MDSHSLDSFTSQSEAIIRSDSPEYDVLQRLGQLMEKLIKTPGSIPREAFVSGPSKFANNLLYRPNDRIFSVMGGNWQPGQTTPIHDHLTWAVVGVCDGEERETIYRRIDDGSDPTKAKLQMVTERINKKGHVTVLGNAGIHRIDNVSIHPSLSIHMYGLDIGTAERHSYDPLTGAITKFVSGYCNVLREDDQD